MNIRSATAALTALVLVLGLASCAGDATAGAGQIDASDPRPEASQQTEESPTPLIAETATTADPSAPEQQYVDILRAAFERDGTQIPNATDEQLISAGEDACAQMEAGKSPEEVRVVDGEEIHASEVYVDSARIAYASLEHLCP